MFKHKLKASLIHLLLSAVVISVLISLILIFWFPSPFLGITNFKDIAIILIAIDLVLGPLLTFVVFNPKKKSLKKDLATIVFVQLFALTYGLYTLFLTHPVYITYFDNGFNIITAKQATPEKARYKQLKISKFSSPVIAYMDVNEKTRNSLFAEAMNGGNDIEARAEHYEPYEDNIDKILEKSLNPNIIFKGESEKEKLALFIKKYGKTKLDYAYLPLIGPAKDVVWVLDKNTAKPIDTISVNPWAIISKKD